MFWKPSQHTLEKRRQWWLEAIAKGETRFVLLRGVLGYGLICFGLSTLDSLLLKHDHSCLEPVNVIWNLMSWVIAGGLFGLLMWHRGQKFLRSEKASLFLRQPCKPSASSTPPGAQETVP